MVSDEELRQLKAVVAAYGASPERWPADARDGLCHCADAHADEPWMNEDRTLDQLLATVPGACMREGLCMEIVAAARSMPRADPERVSLLATSARNPLRRAIFWNAGQAALLAASLLGGLWAGSTASLDNLINGGSLGFAELAPGAEQDSPLGSLWWDTFSGDEAFL